MLNQFGQIRYCRQKLYGQMSLLSPNNTNWKITEVDKSKKGPKGYFYKWIQNIRGYYCDGEKLLSIQVANMESIIDPVREEGMG